MLLIIQLLLKALTTPLVLRAPDHPAAVCTRPTIISYRVGMCVCMRVSTRLYRPTTTTEYVCVCVYVCMASRIYSVCIYSVHVYLLCMRVLKTLTNAPALIAPALIAPTQLLAASGRRDEALYQALGARLRTRRVRAVLCVGLVRTNRSWMIRSTCADIELKLAHAAQPGVCVCGDQTG